MTMTNQNCVAGSHNNKIMNSKQSDRRPVLIKNDVIGGIDRSDRTVGSVALLVLLEIICHRSPASNVVPIEAGFYHQHAVRLLHDGVIERNPRQFAEALAQDLLEI